MHDNSADSHEGCLIRIKNKRNRINKIFLFAEKLMLRKRNIGRNGRQKPIDFFFGRGRLRAVSPATRGQLSDGPHVSRRSGTLAAPAFSDAGNERIRLPPAIIGSPIRCESPGRRTLPEQKDPLKIVIHPAVLA